MFRAYDGQLNKMCEEHGLLEKRNTSVLSSGKNKLIILEMH